MAEDNFVATVNQNYVRIIEGKMGSLNIYKEPGYEVEVARMQMALDDVISRMAPGELDALRAQQNRVLTPAEKAAIAKRDREVMESNRDKPSI
jgi:hypothetical protein